MYPTALSTRTPVLVLLSMVLVLSGCKGKEMGDVSDKVPPPTNPMAQYRDVLAETCGSEHRENLTPDQLREQTAIYYKTLSVPTHEQYDKAIRAACRQDGTQPDCTNRGIITGTIQDGTLKKFVVQVCTPTP